MSRSPTRAGAPPSPPIVVLDGDQRSALAVVRSLGRRGNTVHVVAPIEKSMAGGSRYAASDTKLPSPLTAPTDFRKELGRLIDQKHASVVIPITEASHLAILEGRGELPEFILPTGTHSQFLAATDKVLVRTMAAASGLDIPDEWVFPAGGPRTDIPAEAFPLVVKPRRSVHQFQAGRRQDSASYANTPHELSLLLDRAAAGGIELLAQRRIFGTGTGVFLLRWGGQILASFAHQRIREKPPSGGVSVCCESVIASKRLMADSCRLLERLDWQGAAMVEFKHEASSGKDYLLEVNPRFWGSLQLAVDAGVDFPWLLLRAALGKAEEGPRTWRTGLRSRWLLGEVDHLLALTTKSQARLNVPPGFPGAFRTAMTMLKRHPPGQRFDVLRWSDPLPAGRELMRWCQAMIHGGPGEPN